MSSTTENPTVTFALIAYNQSRYVQDAINGALNQDYSPLEIILSDDCSVDGTFEIMQQAAREYSGPHRIVINQNVQNLNIGGHINAVNRLATGELVVVAAGDDISLPDRVTRLVEAWLKTNKQAGVLHSACRVIDDRNHVVEEQDCQHLECLGSAASTARNNASVIGATEAWDRQLFDFFGDFRDDLVHEDSALPFRSLLAGRPVTYIWQPLVLYREGYGISSAYWGYANASMRRILLVRLRCDIQQKLDDLGVMRNQELESIAMSVLNRCDVAIRFEEQMPPILELMEMIKKAGFAHVARMVAKRVLNRWRDRRET